MLNCLRSIKNENDNKKINLKECSESNAISEHAYDKETRYNKKYIEIAQKISELSHAERKKVGCIIVKNTVIISDGYNGTPAGYENICEDSEGKTKWYTLHAEANAITKLVRIGGISAVDSVLYLTLSPCKECAKLILQSGINKVIYLEDYRDRTGVEFLQKSGVNCFQIKL